MEYYSDMENEKCPQTVTEIPHSFWRALVSKIEQDFSKNSYDDKYSYEHKKFDYYMDALKGEVPRADRPLITRKIDDDSKWTDYVPERSVVMDIIQFTYTYIDPNVITEKYSEKKEANSFKDYINKLFERNALAFKMLENGNIERLINPILADSIKRSPFETGDNDLDQYLNNAVSKFLHHDFKTRKESLEALWDAFERLKTIPIPNATKKISAKTLVDQSSNCQEMRARIDVEATALTKIGNDFMIRHSETNKIPIDEEKHVEYLFHRMFALIWLWLESMEK